MGKRMNIMWMPLLPGSHRASPGGRLGRPMRPRNFPSREGASSTALVAHDYAVSVTQELLARRAEGALGVELQAVHLLNGGLYPDLYRAQPTALGPTNVTSVNANCKLFAFVIPGGALVNRRYELSPTSRWRSSSLVERPTSGVSGARDPAAETAPRGTGRTSLRPVALR